MQAPLGEALTGVRAGEAPLPLIVGGCPEGRGQILRTGEEGKETPGGVGRSQRGLSCLGDVTQRSGESLETEQLWLWVFLSQRLSYP